jgi:glycosyltransferase involved in cell wall biosynthesis
LNERVGVVQVIDTLTAAGAERVAVQLANWMPRDRFAVHLCTTRAEGPLSDLVRADVPRLRLARRGRYDLAAIWRFAAYVRRHRIRVLHAHGPSLFIAAAVSMLPPFPAVVWHDHYGLYPVKARPDRLYRLAVRRARAVLTVNQPLIAWVTGRLRVPADRVSYLPNFATPLAAGSGMVPDLPGRRGTRLVCVANFRAQKDHLTLLRALAIVVGEHPTAHLLLVGEETDAAQAAAVREEIGRLRLDAHVTCMGSRQDIASLLQGCDIGVLSSASEGLPLALLEYGRAALATLVTDVGQCREVLDDGAAGVLVPPGDPSALGGALSRLLGDPPLRAQLGSRLRARVQERYSPEPVIRQLCLVYHKVLAAHG